MSWPLERQPRPTTEEQPVWSNPLISCLRLGLIGLAVLAALLAVAQWWTPFQVPVVDAGDMTAAPQSYLGREVIVTGEWWRTGPSDRGYLVVVLRDRAGGRVACHFEDVALADRSELE